MRGPSTSWCRYQTPVPGDCSASERPARTSVDGSEFDAPEDAPAGAADAGAHRTRRSFLAGTAAVAGLSVAGVAAADEHPTITPAFEPGEISVGETADLELELSVVPETGVNGLTVEVELNGSVAVLTGENEPNDAEWAFTTVDLAHSEESEGDDSMGVVSVNNAGGEIEPGDTDVSLGTVEVVGVGDGATAATLRLEEFQDQLEDPVPDAEAVGGGQLTVSGGATDEDPVDDSDDSDDGTGDDGTDDGDDGTGSDGTGGDGGDDGSSDGGSADDDSAAGGGADDSTDDGDDSTPGFGVATALAAVAAGLGAKLRASAGSGPADGGD